MYTLIWKLMWYTTTLNNGLAKAVDKFQINEEITAWCQHDGAPAHNADDAGEILEEPFGPKWTTNNGPYGSTPRYLDLE